MVQGNGELRLHATPQLLSVSSHDSGFTAAGAFEMRLLDSRTAAAVQQWQGPDPRELTGKREASLHSNQHVPRLWACLDYGRTALSHAYTPLEPSYLMVCSAFHHFVQQRPMCRSHTVPVCHCSCLRDCFSGHRAHAHTSNDAN